MQLGNFSVSLAVINLAESKAFYMKLGFSEVHGDESQGWLILRNEQCTIGLFEGMFEKNILTFNPGWNSEGETLPSFEDVRALQAKLKAQGITPVNETDPDGQGPGSIVIEDPDGNPILIDQHV
jgi:catechol 2,3-dioxygenase-like lactoylglutathione lyase family enzyme